MSETVYGQKEYEAIIESRLKEVYSDRVVDHAIHPRNFGRIEHAHAFAKITGPCGDTMEIWLKVSGGVVTEAGFITDGCVATVATGSMVTEMARDRTIGEALGIGQQDVLDELGGLPEANRHCALLAANTLKKALGKYLAFQNEPWKRLYSKY